MNSLIHTALSRREKCTDSLHRCLCQSYRCRRRGGGQFPCGSDSPPEVVSKATTEDRQYLNERKSQRRRSGVCRSDDVHSLTTKQILYSSNKRPTKQRYRTINSNGVTGRVFGNLRGKNTTVTLEEVSVLPSIILFVLLSFLLSAILFVLLALPASESQAASSLLMEMI